MRRDGSCRALVRGIDWPKTEVRSWVCGVMIRPWQGGGAGVARTGTGQGSLAPGAATPCIDHRLDPSSARNPGVYYPIASALFLLQKQLNVS